MKKRIVSTLLALCMMLALLPGTAWAADLSGECGDRGNNVTWTLNSAGVLTLSGSGNIKDCGYSDFDWCWWAPWSGNRSNITAVTINSGVNSIGIVAFAGAANLTRITIPDTVTSIGDGAFRKCKNLIRITIPNNVTTIGQNAFYDCTRLSNVALPSGLTEIGNYLFYNCSNLATMTIPNEVTAIGQYALAGCSKLTSITIPKGVTSVGNYAFQNCSNVTSVKILSNSLSLGKNAFEGCSNLTSIDLPYGVDTLDDGLFNNCSNLTSVNIPSSVELIGANIFNNCTRLKDIYFSGSQQEWNNIYIDESNDEFLASVTVHYNSGGTTVKNYTVTFELNDGSGSATEKEYKANATLGTLPTPTRTGYKFTGWYTEETGGTKVTSAKKVTADMTLYAHWTKTPTTKTYTITLSANGGKVSPASIKVESGKTYFNDLPTPTRSGFKFDGWYTTKTGNTKITATTKATANRTIYAHWTRDAGSRTHMVTFDANGGSVYQDRKIVFNGILYRDLPTPTKNNAHFQGWYTKKTGGTKVTAATRVALAADQTLYAHWLSSATVKSTQRGTYRVTIPASYDLAMYSASSTARIASVVETTGYQTVTCTQRATLSNGAVRYYGKVGGKTGWFTYSCEMDVK